MSDVREEASVENVGDIKKEFLRSDAAALSRPRMNKRKGKAGPKVFLVH